MTKYLAIALVICISIIGFLYNSSLSKTKEVNRLKRNEQALLSDITKYKTRDGEWAFRVETLTLTTRDLERHRAELVEQVKKMGVRIKNLQSSLEKVTIIKDTIFIPTTDTLWLGQPSKSFSYEDPWVNIDGIVPMTNGDAKITYKVTDSVLVLKSIEYKRFIFRSPIWGVKSINVDIKNANPNAEIVKIEALDLFVKKK